MSPYYKWNAKRDKFIKFLKPPKKNYKVIYRLAKNNDKKALSDFEIDCVKVEPEVFEEYEYFQKTAQSVKSINFNQRQKFKVVIALTDEKIVGKLSMSWYFNYETNRKDGVITGLWVLKPYRMAGIGQGLVEFAKKEFKKWGVEYIELIVGTFNLGAIEFYKKLGFKIRKVGQAIL